MEIIPSLFGIRFGLFTTFTEYVPNLLNLDYYQAGILFGIGLGAGSLKELVDKDSDSGCICVELPELPKNTQMKNAKQKMNVIIFLIIEYLIS